MAGDAGEGQGRDELLRCRRHDDMHVERLLLQRPHQLRRFIGGNPSGNADSDLHGSDSTSGCGFIAFFAERRKPISAVSFRRRAGGFYVCKIGV